jgi:hypothetical protein
MTLLNARTLNGASAPNDQCALRLGFDRRGGVFLNERAGPRGLPLVRSNLHFADCGLILRLSEAQPFGAAKQ